MTTIVSELNLEINQKRSVLEVLKVGQIELAPEVHADCVELGVPERHDLGERRPAPSRCRFLGLKNSKTLRPRKS